MLCKTEGEEFGARRILGCRVRRGDGSERRGIVGEGKMWVDSRI